MANALTTSSLAKRWPNAVALSSWISEGGPSIVLSSPHSGTGHGQSDSGIVACCDPFSVRRAVNGPLLPSISLFLALNHGKPKPRSYAFIRKTKTSDLSTGSRGSKYWTKRLAFWLSFADIITWSLRPWVDVNAGSWGNSSFLTRLGYIEMLLAPQLISALPCCMLPCMFCTRTSWMICGKSGLSVPHWYWHDIRARPSRMTRDYKAIRCGCIPSKIPNKAQFPKYSDPNSVSSSLSHRVIHRER